MSHETVYTSLYLQAKGNLKKELISALRSRRLRRRLRKRGESAPRSILGDIVPISDRPPRAADRAFPGHWEGDLIMGAFNRSAIVTVVERRNRFLLLGDLPEGHDAQSVYECLFELTADLPDLLRKSLTWDRGVEMAKWNDLIALSPELQDSIEELVLEDFDALQAGSTTERKQMETQCIELGAQRQKLLDAHYAGAIPLDLPKSEQERIAGQLTRIQDQLTSLDANFEQARAVLADTLDLT